MTRWNERAANTWNKHLSVLTSFTAYGRRQEWLAGDPGRRLERRKVSGCCVAGRRAGRYGRR